MNKKIALYPGTFDPITLGHVDIIKRATKIVDTLHVSVANNIEKKCLFSLKDRMDIVTQTIRSFPKSIKDKIKVSSFNMLTVDYCKKLMLRLLYGDLELLLILNMSFNYQE